MDTEQQIRLNFLDEAEEYLDQMESNLLGLTDTAIDAQKVDIVLRAAHSIKGGAAMMGFDILSQVAHRLEDFFKILRVRYAAVQIETEVETLLLKSVDCLRHISDRNREGAKVAISEIEELTHPIFAILQQHLGDLEAADENALLAQDEDVDPALLIFEEGVDEVLDRFEAKLENLGLDELGQELSATASELIGFGHMAGLDSFVDLCESIQHHAQILSPSNINPLVEQALKSWKRTHALVLRGSVDKIPSHIEGFESNNSVSQSNNQESLGNLSIAEFDPLDVAESDLSTLQSAFEPDADAEFDPLEVSELDLSTLQSAFEPDTDTEFDPLEVAESELSALQSAFEPDADELELTIMQPVIAPSSSNSEMQKTSEVEQVEKMVRVPTSQLKQFNTLFEQLVLNRNSLNLRLERLQDTVALMTQRMFQIESSNAQLKQWYDQASIKGLLNKNEQSSKNTAYFLNRKEDSFDSLEMDRYTDIQLICQEQIETIVQLQEVATDIELGVQEVHQSVRDLHYTTKSMQGNVTRTQMLPFSDAVKRLPRVIRDLNQQHNKKAELKIIGEKTLLDRSVIEALSVPLMHLLRNSFDHGIEDPQTRTSKGKAETGTITIQASNQGAHSIITLSDDGDGIRLAKIRDRVCQMGVSSAEVELIPEAELLNFIFEPGFSTAEQVTQLSGRGVGMDIVKTNLEEIRGDIQVATKQGQGTSFSMRIPFSLSILRVAILEQNGIIFAIPANYIKELLPFDLNQVTVSNNNQYISWNQIETPLIEIENILLYRRAYKALDLMGEPTINRTMTLIVGEKKSSIALKINRFWSEQESTIRTIESPIPLPKGIISSVVFGDGKVIPLVDPMILMSESMNKNSERLQSKAQQNEDSNIPTVKTILVVDDSINVRRYLSLTLEKAGYLVEQARDGREAVDKLLGGLNVQAIICDLEMPRLDGYGVLEEIKERPEFEQLPIAMLTSRSNEKHRKLAMNLGASAYFAKPYNEQKLIDKLAELVLS